MTSRKIFCKSIPRTWCGIEKLSTKWNEFTHVAKVSALARLAAFGVSRVAVWTVDGRRTVDPRTRRARRCRCRCTYDHQSFIAIRYDTIRYEMLFNFWLIIYSHSSTNPDNLVKIGLVDFWDDYIIIITNKWSDRNRVRINPGLIRNN